MATTEYPGNITPAPGFQIYGTTVDDELMYSMHAFTQKGRLVKAGQGVLLLGTVMAQKNGDKLWYAYNNSGGAGGGVTNEQQSIVEGGTGLTSFTLTYSGQTTASIPEGATPAQVQAALVALSNILAGQVVVTGTSSPVNMVVTFQGTLANTNVAQMTSTPTGGSGTLTVTTILQGNSSDGINVPRGFLRRTVDTGTDATQGSFQENVVIAGLVKMSKTTAAGNLDSNAITVLGARVDSVQGFVKI